MPNLARIGGPAAFLALTALLVGLQTAGRLNALAREGAPPAQLATPSQAIAAKQGHRPSAVHRALPPTERPLEDPRLLLDQLAALSVESDPDTAELEGLLTELARHGDAATWDLHDFLLRTTGATPGSGLAAVRRAAIGLLLANDLPDVELIAADLMETTQDAHEVWQLGRYLESVRPGAYGDLIRHAGQQVLFASGDETQLPGEFFQLIGEAGDPSIAGLLADVPGHRVAYASVALALIPDGTGLPLVEEDARLFANGHFTQDGRLAIELLAQHAHELTTDSQVLLELAERGRIPSDLWDDVVELIAGNRTITLEAPETGWRQTSTIYRPEGNQSIYRVRRDPAIDDYETISRRLMLLHQLLPHAPEPLRGAMTTAERHLCDLYAQSAADIPINQPLAAGQLHESHLSCTRGRTS